MLADRADDLADLLAGSLSHRLAELKAVSERLERFAFEPGEDAPEFLDEEAGSDAALRDLLLRALGRAVDPLNFALIEQLAGSDASVGALARHSGLPRGAVSERINDLLQVGLVGRTHRGDEVALTPSGRAIADLVASVVDKGRGSS